MKRGGNNGLYDWALSDLSASRSLEPVNAGLLSLIQADYLYSLVHKVLDQKLAVLSNLLGDSPVWIANSLQTHQSTLGNHVYFFFYIVFIIFMYLES